MLVSWRVQIAGACGVSAGLTGERGRENGMTMVLS
jgi:hypothetical protein